MRRLQTERLPGGGTAPSIPYCWDFHLVAGVWALDIPMRGAGSVEAGPRAPEQGAWLQTRGYAAPSVFGRISLEPGQLEALIGVLEPRGPSWAAHEARAELDLLDQAGRLDEARTASEVLRDLAPTWDEGRMARVSLLINRCRDAAAAEADLDSLPAGVLSPAERRRLRQSVALLRDDWVTYATVQEATVFEGGRHPWDWETLGLARWAAGDLEGSLRAFEDSTADHPGHREIALRAVEVLFAMGRREEATARIEALAAAGPAHAKTLAWRGWMRRDADPVAAAADYEAALVVDPAQPVARVGRGLLRMAAGDRAGARADLSPFTHCGWADAAEAWRSFCATEAG